ncbi:Uncharacterised protein [Mycobacteroides abscessus subsp. abscessus]|nr:Uncharacterised protein [Mycobacteroides abscessus subsp. abscessus]
MIVGIPPAANPTTSSRPSEASVRTASSKAGPPIGSTTMSTPAPPVASRTALAQPSSRGRTISAPTLFTNSVAAVLFTTAITLAPMPLAIWIAAVPMPPAAPSTSTVSPARNCPRRA